FYRPCISLFECSFIYSLWFLFFSFLNSCLAGRFCILFDFNNDGGDDDVNPTAIPAQLNLAIQNEYFRCNNVQVHHVLIVSFH
ncbi:hypothetical protein DOY81_004279, partial [Sarcophaga bullata]